MMGRFYSVALNTFMEAIRQPIYGVLLLATAGLLILNVSLAAFTLSDDDKLLLDLGLSTLLLSGLFLAAFTAAGILTREIENKTVLTVISKPVSRPVFFVGKFVGLAAALGVAFYLSFLVFMLAQRHGVLQATSDPWDAPVLVFGAGGFVASLLAAAFCNYFYGKHFATTAILFNAIALTVALVLVGFFDKRWEVIPFASSFPGGQVVIAAYLVLLSVLVTAAVALAAATRFGQIMTLVTCVAVLAVGLISDYAFGQRADTSILAASAYYLLPNLGPFWIIDGLHADAAEVGATGTYVLLSTGYAALLSTGILAIGVALFQKREVG